MFYVNLLLFKAKIIKVIRKFYQLYVQRPVPEIIDPVFAKTSQNARFLLSENERFGLVFVKTGSINSGTGKNPYVRNSVIFRINVKTTLNFWFLLNPSSSHVRRACCETYYCSGRLLWGGGGPFSLGSKRVLQAVQEVPIYFISTVKPAWLVQWSI
jgi:hypothetical protein